MHTEEKTLARRFVENVDWLLVGALVYLILVGLITVYSATLHYGSAGKYIVTQGMAVLIGFVGFLIFSMVNYQFFRSLIAPVYLTSIVLLVSVLIFGTVVRGTKGWFNLGYFSFQPVEVAKLMFILVIAGYLDSRWRDTKKFSAFTVSLLLLLGHILLILLQPDFSSTLVYFPITLILLYIAGTAPLYLFGVMLFGALAAGIPLMATFFKLQPKLIAANMLVKYFVIASKGGIPALAVLCAVVVAVFVLWWFIRKLRVNVPLIIPAVLSLIIVFGSVSSFVVQKSLKEYQRKRLIVFLNPEIDPLGSGYNIIQSKIAIGSGLFLGKGLFQGTQTQLGFLPEQHTDFVFAVIGEETGYVFSQLILLFYFIIVWRAMVVARESRDRYGSLVATGIATMFAFYAVINIGMVMGLMPATGLPLPFLSYGGSSMVSSFWALGILFSIHMRRFTH